MKRHESQTAVNHSRSGFSLIELLVVIVIIGILMSLILPALSGVRNEARMKQVSAEISQLDNAIAKFKSVYNVEPPSSLYVPVVGDPWAAADRSKVRAIWPQFDFATNGGLGAGDFHLSGAECLVFFLGGVPTTTSPPALLGFSKNPQRPWAPDGANREGPFFEFDNARLVDVDADSVLEYVDSLPDQNTPYAYFSSQGRTYTKSNAAGTLLSQQDDFDIHGGNTNTEDFSSIYLKTASPAVPHRSSGYQIISPGWDGLYGLGGVFTDGSELTGARSAEADNITNFTGGALKP
jgi:prepilin-type N-terminal cleavage/methylation domain-containing protein